ncbi:glycosyltransferase [Oceanomicrobium pacificus]|uniref:Glycosyltransferase n=1 Tax=Oceanomicrobium pacificus TaxID=2692916 RepID=A0A6B0TWN1_9RHOB|nr:glycosyltransferase [Oceanomicrobium pacificus]MXU65564.1 glycosyltransferase [Oceanomicrobium pacificus]
MVLPNSSESPIPAHHAAAPQVLQLLPGRAPGDDLPMAMALVRAGVADGLGMSVAGAGGRMEPHFRRLGATTLELPKRSAFSWRDSGLRALLKDQVDLGALSVIHAWGLEQANLAVTLAEESGAHLFLHLRRPLPKRGLFDRRTARLIARCDRILCPSAFVRDSLDPYLGTADDRSGPKVDLMQPGVDLDLFAEDAVSPERTISLAAAWGVIEDPRPIVLVPGQFADTDWQDRIAAGLAATIAAAGPDADLQFIVTGDAEAPRMERFRRAVTEQGLAPFVRLTGHCADMEAALKLSALLLSCPSEAEGIDHLALRAQAMGRPVVLCRNGAAAEVVEPDVTGWLIDQNDPRSMAGALGLALSLDASQRAHLALAARSRIQSRFGLARMQDRLVGLYRDPRAPVLA